MCVTLANAFRDAIEQLDQDASGEDFKVAYVDQGYTGERPAAAVANRGIRIEVVRLFEGKRGFVLLPRPWVVERFFA